MARPGAIRAKTARNTERDAERFALLGAYNFAVLTTID